MPWADKDALTPQNLNARGAFVINVKDPEFGAKGDNSTDDTAAIQAAITASKDIGGDIGDIKAVVYIPPGRYNITAPLQVANVPIWGAGPTQFYGSAIQIAEGFVGTHAIIADGNGATGAVGNIRDIVIYGALATDVVGGLKLDGLILHGIFDNIFFAAIKADALTLTGTAGLPPTLNTFIDMRSGVSCLGHGLTMELGLSNTFINCAFQDHDKNGINITSAVESVGRTIFIHPWIEIVNKVTAGAAIFLNGSEGTSFYTPQINTYGTAGGSASHGFELVLAHRTLIDTPDISAVTAGSSFKIKNNGSRLLRLSRMPSNFVVADATGMDTIINNDIVEWIDNGVVRISGRSLESRVTTLADDATPTVEAGNLFKTGGVTTITDFDDGLVGQTIKILAAHSVKITDGAPIILAGGADYDMTDSDTLTLIMFNDQVWQEVSRSVN